VVTGFGFVDAVDLELARHRFSAVADEMGAVLRRTAYSPNIKERADCSAAVFVSGGELLAQAEHIPVHLGSMPASVRAVIDTFGDDVEFDAQYAVNDPYHGGTHLNDLTLVRPVAGTGGLIGWVANRAHHADVGGTAPGSMPASARTLAEEGHVIAPCVAVRRGEWVMEFVEPLLDSTRTPTERLGDLSAQLGANEVGAARLVELSGQYGRQRFPTITDAALAYGERRMRAALAELPDGAYEFADHVEDIDGTLRRIAVRVTIDGTVLNADFAGTDAQTMSNINAVEAVTASAVYYAVRVATDPTIPANGGCYRAISVDAPVGSLVNAEPPAAVAAGNVETSQRIADVLLGALAKANPTRVPAASQGTMNNVLVGSESFAYYETLGGGQGARPSRDGQSGIHTGMTNTKNTPIESLTLHYPFRVLAYTLRRGSGGVGAFRGGEGIVREYEFLEPSEVSLIGDRRLTRPWGLNGGGPGAAGEDWLIRRSGEHVRLPGKVTLQVEPGERVRVLTPGGGGWGAPARPTGRKVVAVPRAITR
jgi:N-methylhydantoinase B